jgi:DNA (cytosine-5)-methyltransferase 1
MRFLSTFSGVGGMEVGLKAADPTIECIGFSEIDKHASTVLKYHYPEVKNYGDIKQIRTEELPDFDILVGGFPCQTFSIAGKRMGFNDTRGTLFYEIARIAKDKRPSILLLENVKGLLNHNKGNTFKTIISTLDELGYDAEWELLNSKYFGVPQNRERVYIIGHIRGKPWRPIFPLGKTDKKDTRKIQELTRSESKANRIYSTEGIAPALMGECGGLGAKTGLYAVKKKLEDNKPRWGDHYATGEDISPTLMAIGKTDVANIIIPTQIGNSDKFGNSKKEAGEEAFTLRATEPNGIIVHSLQTRNPDRPSLKLNLHAGGSGHIQKEEETYCLDTGNTQAIESDARIRRLTPIECERLQAFPDDWTKKGMNEKGEIVDISDSQRYKMMGNALTTTIVKTIWEEIQKKNL